MRLVRIAAAAILVALAGGAAAQDWPTRPITLVVPFAAGGGIDVSVRIQAQHMGEILGQSIVIENIGGAAGTTGSLRVAKAAPDGYTFLIGNSGTHAYSQSLYKKPHKRGGRIHSVGCGVGIAAYPDRPQGPPGQQPPGVRRLRESKPGQDAVRLGGRRCRHPPAMRAPQHGDGRENHPCPVSRRRTGHAGPDRRAHRLHVRHDPDRGAAGQAEDREGNRRDGAAARSDHRDPDLGRTRTAGASNPAYGTILPAQGNPGCVVFKLTRRCARARQPGIRWRLESAWRSHRPTSAAPNIARPA